MSARLMYSLGDNREYNYDISYLVDVSLGNSFLLGHSSAVGDEHWKWKAPAALFIKCLALLSHTSCGLFLPGKTSSCFLNHMSF